MPTCLKCGDVFKNHLYIDGKSHNLCKRKFCLKCSPFGSKNRRNLLTHINGSHVCRDCGVSKKLNQFTVKFDRNNKPYPFSYCKKCASMRVRRRSYRFKNNVLNTKVAVA